VLGNELRGGEVLGKMLSDLVGKGLDDVLVPGTGGRSEKCSETVLGDVLFREAGRFLLGEVLERKRGSRCCLVVR
jgi:hypothetical protein